MEEAKYAKSTVLERHARDQFGSIVECAQTPSALRRICLAISGALLQYPLLFEAQQLILGQPVLLRNEVEQALSEMAEDGPFKVLDYGCGSGNYTGLVQRERYLGIDCDAAMLKRAAAKHPGYSFIQSSNLSGISDELEDVAFILLIGVIHHLSARDLVAILSNLRQKNRVRFLSIDTLRCTSKIGSLVQLFERGEFLRTHEEHDLLVNRVANIDSYKTIPYGNCFELAVYRGHVKDTID